MAPVISFNSRQISHRPERVSGERFSRRQIPLSMAFQPIVDVDADRIFAYEALVRGVNREPASSLLARDQLGSRDIIDRANLDQDCRIAAIDWAARLGLMHTEANLCINFSPNSIYETRSSLESTCNFALDAGVPLDRLVFEITEMEEIRSHDHLRGLVREYRSQGLRTAIDDFGAGYAGLSMLAEFQPDIVKIDRALTHCIHQRRASQAIVRAIVQVCRDLDIEVIAEGVEKEPEFDTLYMLGIRRFQGYFFGWPAFEHLPVWKPLQRQYKLI